MFGFVLFQELLWCARQNTLRLAQDSWYVQVSKEYLSIHEVWNSQVSRYLRLLQLYPTIDLLNEGIKLSIIIGTLALTNTDCWS